MNSKFDDEIKLLIDKNHKTMGILEYARQVMKEQARSEGQLEAKTSIAKKMKSEGISQSLIAKFTGLPIKQIKALK